MADKLIFWESLTFMMNDSSNKKTTINRERFLSVLNDITFAALEAEHLDDLMQLLADRLAEIINADGCFLTLWDEQSKVARPAAAYGPLRNEYKEIVTEAGEPTITEHVLREKKSVVVKNAKTTQLTSSRITQRLPSESILAIPIFKGQHKLGAALITFDNEHEFTDQEIEYCEQAVRQIGLAIVNLQNISALKDSEEKFRKAAAALKESEAHLAEAQANAKVGSWELELGNRRLHWSSGLYRLFDIEPQESPPVRENLLKLVDERDRIAFGEQLEHAAATLDLTKIHVRTITGRHLICDMFYDESRDLLTGAMRDVTEEQRLEAELLQARKMEAVGTLAGGIAHNFNNILTVIMGNYELLKDSTLEHSTEREVLNQCLDATERAAALTRQLLVVSRKHELNPTQMDVNALTSSMIDLLRPLIGDHITTATHFAPQLLPVYADQGHLEQVLINLVLNARDALEHGGKLTVTTANIDQAGEQFVSIEVRDDGPGIDAETLPNIFDPFFTTKDEGKGTGLGLATVASIVEQSNGRILVDSTPDEGTRFTVLLPTMRGASRAVTPVEQEAPGSSAVVANAKILLVEDNESLRDLAVFVLKQAEYDVIAVKDGQEALAIYQETHSQLGIDLLLTDVQLPQGISGPQLASQLREHLPELPVIFMSGLRDVLPKQHNGVFLPKPFRPNELLNAVSSLLIAQSPRVSA